MSMIAGTVTVADDESASGSGLALEIYTALKLAFQDDLAPIDTTADPFAQDITRSGRVATLRGYAKMANAIGPAVVVHIQANAIVSLASVVATVDTATSVGTVPSPVVPLDPIDPPSANVDLPVTGAGGATTLGVS